MSIQSVVLHMEQWHNMWIRFAHLMRMTYSLCSMIMEDWSSRRLDKYKSYVYSNIYLIVWFNGPYLYTIYREIWSDYKHSRILRDNVQSINWINYYVWNNVGKYIQFIYIMIFTIYVYIFLFLFDRIKEKQKKTIWDFISYTLCVLFQFSFATFTLIYLFLEYLFIIILKVQNNQ